MKMQKKKEEKKRTEKEKEKNKMKKKLLYREILKRRSVAFVASVGVPRETPGGILSPMSPTNILRRFIGSWGAIFCSISVHWLSYWYLKDPRDIRCVL